MKIKIVETGETKELEIIDPKTGVNWIADLMGNHGALPSYDDDSDNYIMLSEDFHWWENLLTDYQKAEYRIAEMERNLFEPDLLQFRQALQDISVDLEDLPNHLNMICEEYEKKGRI